MCIYKYIYTHIMYICIYIYIHISHHTNPLFCWCQDTHRFGGTPIWKGTHVVPYISPYPSQTCAFRVFACASAQRAVKAACIGSRRRPCSVQQIVQGFKQQMNHQS